jgi:hypothetical protein
MLPLEQMLPPSPSPGQSGVFNYKGIPQNPRSLLAKPSTGKCTIQWSAPADHRGADSYRVYLDNESNLFQAISDNTVTQIDIPLNSGQKRTVLISCYSSLRRESNKVSVVASAM